MPVDVDYPVVNIDKYNRVIWFCLLETDLFLSSNISFSYASLKNINFIIKLKQVYRDIFACYLWLI